MLTITRRQMDALNQASLQRFEAQLSAHLHLSAPRACALAGGGAQVDVIARRCIRSARSSGYPASRQIMLYSSLVVGLGIGFDQDPQLPWAADGLTNEGIEDATERLGALCESADRFLAECRGRQDRYARQAAARLRTLAIDSPPDRQDDDLVDDACELLEALWPERFAVQEAAPTAAMVAASFGLAAGYGIAGPAGRLGFAVASFVLGHEFHIDPLHPWAGSILTDTTYADAAARERALLRSLPERLADVLDADKRDTV